MATQNEPIRVSVSADLPGDYAEGSESYARGDRQGQMFVRPFGKSAQNAAYSGACFLARNPTNGTGLASIAAATAVSDTQAFIHVYNPSTTRTVVLDKLKVRVTVAGANGTTTGFFTKVYSGSSRYSSGGSTISEVNTNPASTATSSAQIQAGAVTLAAANGSEALLSAQALRSVIAVAGDHYWFDFGPDALSAHNGLVVSGTAISNLVIPCSPVALGPSSGFQFGLYGASQDTAAQYEFELTYFEL
jgi:hypothetical protein